MTQQGLTLIDRLAGIPPGGPIDIALRKRAEVRRAVEDDYRRLLHPIRPQSLSLTERRAVAAFVAVLLDEDQTRAHFLGLLRMLAPEPIPLAALIEAEAEGASNIGPYGTFPPRPHSADDLDGPVYRVSPALRAALGERLAVALEHAHRMALYPQDLTLEDQSRLAMAGLHAECVAILDQIVDLVGIQARIVAGLRGYLAMHHPCAIAAE